MALPFGSGPLWSGYKPQGVPPDPPLIASPAIPAIPYVGGTALASKAASPLTFTLSCATGSGIVILGTNGGSSPTTITDTVGNTYSKLVGAFSDGSAAHFLWVCPYSKGTNPAITITTFTNVVVMAFEVVGANPGFFIDGFATSLNSGKPSVRTSSPNGLIISHYGVNLPLTAPTGYTRQIVSAPPSGDPIQGWCWSNTPLPQWTQFAGWTGGTPNGALAIAIRGAGSYPDHAPLKGFQLPLVPPGQLRPVLPFGAPGAAAAPGANNYSLSLGFVSYGLTIKNVSQGIALASPKISYALTLEGVTLDTAEVAGFVAYSLSLKTLTFSRAVTLSLATTSYSHSPQSVSFVSGPAIAAGTTSYAHSIRDVTLTAVVANATPAVVETPAGGPVRAVQYIIKIDGKEFVTPNLQQAIDLLNQAKALAKRHAMELARAATEKKPKAPRIKLPKITGSAPVRELVLEVRKEIAAIYESALRDAEIAYWIELDKRNGEDEDVFWLMF